MKKIFAATFFRTLLTLLLMSGTSVTAASSTKFIKDVMLVGAKEEAKVAVTMAGYCLRQGWKDIDKDLNKGAGGDYIYLLYKLDNNDDGFNYDCITGFVLSNDYKESFVYDGRTYFPVSCIGDDGFVGSKGDLNHGTGSSTKIFLYYTRDAFPDKRVATAIAFGPLLPSNNHYVCLVNGNSGYNLNTGTNGDGIYMFVSTTTANEPLTIGNGTSGASYLPLNMSHSYSLVQQLYTAEEIKTAGTISALAFYYRDTYKQPFTKKKTRVYLKQTANSSLSGSTMEVVSANNGYTQVYDGAFSASGEGWVYLRLDTPYEYDGNQNLIVCCYDDGSDAYTGSQTFSVHEKSGMAWSYGSNSSIDLGNAYTSMYTQSRNNIRINIDPNPYRNPIDLTVSRFTDKSAVISWNAPKGSHPTIQGYEWQYSPAEPENWSSLTSTTDPTATLSGLSASTEYLFRVRINYSGGQSSYSILRFTTAVELPYDCGFENGMPGWSQVDHNHFYNVDLTGISGDARHDGNYGYMFRCYDTDPVPQYLISPGLPVDKPILVSFYYKNFAGSSPETFRVGYSTTTNDAGAFTWVDEITAEGTDWQQYQHSFDAGAQYVAVQYKSNSYRLYLDDFDFAASSPYAKPTNLSVSELGDQSVKLEWAAPSDGANGYAYQYRQVNGGSWSNETSVSGTSLTLTGLNANTTYDFRIKAFHGSHKTHPSNYETIRFLTEGPAEPIPHSQDFESGMGGWRLEKGHGRSGITTDQHHDGSYSFEFDEGSPEAQFLRSPLLESGSQKIVSFYFKNYAEETSEPVTIGYRSVFRVGWSTKTNRLADFVFGPEEEAKNGHWTRYSLQVPAEAQYVLIMVEDHQAWLYVDDISITDVPRPMARQATVMGEVQYVTTFYDGAKSWMLPAGALAYTVEKEGEDFVFYCIDDVIPAGTPAVILMDKTAEDTGTTKFVDLRVTNVKKTAPHPYNILRGAESPVTVSDGKIDGKTVYVLEIVDGEVGLYPFTGSVIPAGKAYYLP